MAINFYQFLFVIKVALLFPQILLDTFVSIFFLVSLSGWDNVQDMRGHRALNNSHILDAKLRKMAVVLK